MTRALEIDPQISEARLVSCWSLYDLSDFENAFACFEAMGVYSGRILSLGALGRFEEAGKLLEDLLELAEMAFVHPSILAMAYLGAGHEDQAVEAMQQAAETGGRDTLWMTIAPSLAPLRQDPRVRNLLESMRRADGSLGDYQP